jgi:uncharacterized membrane protein
MNQEEIDRAEWENPDNWSTIYFSKKDSRSWVPKRNPKHGSTINFGHPSGARWIYYLFLFFLLFGGLLGASAASAFLGGG